MLNCTTRDLNTQVNASFDNKIKNIYMYMSHFSHSWTTLSLLLYTIYIYYRTIIILLVRGPIFLYHQVCLMKVIHVSYCNVTLIFCSPPKNFVGEDLVSVLFWSCGSF